jgi:3-hydroxyisobutyrate dehydrogenase
MKAGAIFIDNTTASADVARELACGGEGRLRLHRRAGFRRPGRRGKRRPDRDVRRRSGRLRQGQTGDRVFRPHGRTDGPTGAGQLTKMVNQICIAGLVQGLSEGIISAKKAGLDVEKVISVDLQGRGRQSWQMENRWETMIDGKFDTASPSTGCARISASCLKTDNNGASPAGDRAVDQFYKEVQTWAASAGTPPA